MFRTEIVDRIKTHMIFENPAVYKIKCKNPVQPDKPQITICRMRTACCIPNATNTHTQYVTLTGFPLQQWLRERA